MFWQSSRPQLSCYATYHVIIGVLDSCERQHTKQGQGCRDGRQGGDLRDQLEDQQAEEVEVGRSLELFKQVEWYEGEEAVLGGLDEIILETGQHEC